MNKRITITIFAISLSACSQGNSAPAPVSAIDNKIAELARIMNAITPKKLDGGISLEAAGAEGNTLVLKFNGLPEWRPHVSDAEAGKLYGAAICDGPQVQALVREGGRLRIDGVSPSGANLPPLPICGT